MEESSVGTVERTAEVHKNGPVLVGDAKKHFALNGTSQGFFFLFNALTSLIMVSFQLNHLGKSNYGVVYLASQVVAWMNLVQMFILSAIGRFVILHLGRGDLAKARSYFNTQFRAMLWGLVILLPIVAGVSYLSPVLFKVTVGQERNSQILFFATYVCFLMSLFAYPFQLATYVTQRFYIRNIIEIANQTLRYGTWVVLFSMFTPAIWEIGVGYLIGTTALVTGSIIVFYRLTPQLSPSLREFDMSKFKEMTNMNVWLTFGQIGSMLYLLTDSPIINRIMGPTVGGVYSTILGVYVMLRLLSGNLLSMLGPSIISCFGRNDFAGMHRQTARAMKIFSVMAAIGIGIICGLSVPFLSRWVHAENRAPAELMWLMLAPLVFTIGTDPMSSTFAAANRMVASSTTTFVGGLVKVGLAIVLVKYTQLGFYGVVVADIISQNIKNLILFPFMSAKITKGSPFDFYRSLIPSIFIFGATAGSAFWLSNRYSLATYPKLACSGVGLLVVFFALSYFTAFNRDERDFIYRLTPWGKRAAAS